jgi:hypothetical protein
MKLTLHWPEVTRHLIAFALGWCLLSILFGLFYAFDAMESSKASLAISDFFKITSLTLLIGLLLLSIPLLIWKLMSKKGHSKK